MNAPERYDMLQEAADLRRRRNLIQEQIIELARKRDALWTAEMEITLHHLSPEDRTPIEDLEANWIPPTAGIL